MWKTIFLLIIVFINDIIDVSSVSPDDTPCLIIPTKESDCIIIKQLPGREEKCVNSYTKLEYTGINKDEENEEWISVNLEDQQNGGNWFIRLRDCICSNQCCSRPTRRFLFDGLQVSPSCRYMILNLQLVPQRMCCKHGGLFDNYTSPSCTCPVGFTGRFCEMKPPTCKNHNDCCKHTGYFVSLAIDWCACPPNRVGHRCEIRAKNLCTSSPCVNGGICIADKGVYFCKCGRNYQGKNCEIFNALTISTIQANLHPTTSYLHPVSTHLSPVKTHPTIPVVTSCADNPLVRCNDTHTCTSSLKSYCPLTCGICLPPTTKPPCIDDPRVRCSVSTVCSSLFKSVCPLTCGLCVPPTTKPPCIDDPRVRCSDPTVCSSSFKSVCPLTCGLCGTVSTVKTVRTTTTSWFHITNG